MKTVLYGSLTERFPDGKEPDWYDRAVLSLRGGADYGLFGRYLYHLILSRPGISTVLNIGTARGHSAVCAAKALADADRTGIVHTVDVIPPNQYRDWHVTKHPENDPARGQEMRMRDFVEQLHSPDDESVPIEFHTGDSRDVLESLDIAPDLVFHDALHTYKKVRRDFDQADRLGQNRPLHVFDDCYLYRDEWTYRPFTRRFWTQLDEVPKVSEVIQHIRQYGISKTTYPGVTRAVEEIIDENDWETVEVIQDEDHAPITILVP